MNEKIELLINSVAEAGSRNRLSVEQIRRWLSDYLEMYQDDVKRFSDLLGKPHTDVLMADFDKSRPALFVVAVFTEKTVTIGAGRGESSIVRNFLERESPIDAAEQMISNLASRFFVSAMKVTVSRQEFEKWLFRTATNGEA
jgi:hypothetical protein